MSKLTVYSVLEIPDKSKLAKSPRKLQSMLEECYNKKLFVDAEIRLQGKIFKAHKSVLAFYSPIFQESFYGTKMSSSVRINKNVNPIGFDILLRYIYSSRIPYQTNLNYLLDAYAAAQMFRMTGIENGLENYIYRKFINSKISERKFWPLLEKSHSLNLKEFENKLLVFAKKHIQILLDDEDFLKAGNHIIKLVLNLKNLTISESEILEKIARWKDSNSNLALLDDKVQDLLSCVNFKRLSPKEFCNIVSKYDKLIPSKDAFDILMCLTDPMVSSLPKWCTSSQSTSINSPLNASSLNFETYSKADKFKSLEDLTKLNNLKSIKERQILRGLQSQEDLRKLKDSKHLDVRDSKLNIEAQSFPKTLPDSFCQMLEKGLFTDVYLRDCNGIEIYAHRLILALGSEIFAEKLYGPSPAIILQFTETADELKSMLRYFYGTGEPFCKVSEKSIIRILRKFDLSLKYACYPLIQNCLQAFNSTSVTQKNFWKLFPQVNQHENFKINTDCLIKYALSSPTKVFAHEDFYRADERSLTCILRSDFINMSEYDILEYVARWLEKNFNKFSSYESRKKLLEHIRFGELKAEQFFDFIKVHDVIIEKEDAFAILTCLFKDSKSNLPEWCYRGPSRSLFYDKLTIIGSDILIPWKSNASKGKNYFKCYYTATISSRQLESQIQFLELTWKVNPNKRGRHMNHKCKITIKFDSSKDITFNGIDVSESHRIMVPIFIQITRQNPRVKFTIEVNTTEDLKYYFTNHKKIILESMVIESDLLGRCCICDAVVDNYTSENIKITDELLLQNCNAVVPTELFLHLNNA